KLAVVFQILTQLLSGSFADDEHVPTGAGRKIGRSQSPTRLRNPQTLHANGSPRLCTRMAIESERFEVALIDGQQPLEAFGERKLVHRHRWIATHQKPPSISSDRERLK